MSYESRVIVECGQTLYQDCNQDGDENSHRDGQNVEDSNGTQEKYIENLYQTIIFHNGKEIWQCLNTKELHLVCFKEVVDQITFIPQIVICKEESYGWGFEDLKCFQRQIKSCPGGSFALLYFMDLHPEAIPNNFLFYLKNKLMADFLQTPVKEDDSANWCMLLQKMKNPVDRTPNEGFQCPRNYVSSSVFKNNRKWNSLYQSVKRNLPVENKIDWDFNYQNNGTWLYLGESFSVHQARVCLNLKLLPYISQNTKLKTK